MVSTDELPNHHQKDANFHVVLLEPQGEAGDEGQRVKSREERRRTGRYVAAGTAIFLSLLGIYQALLNGTPEYAALFAPAVIMFIYVLWILYASKNQTARMLKLQLAAERAYAQKHVDEDTQSRCVEEDVVKTDKSQQGTRSYSIA